VQQSFDHAKSLQELEQHNWGEAAPTDTPLVARCMLLRRKPLAEFTTEDLRVMIGQQIGLPHLVALAVGVLESNPLAEGNFYPGDLLCAVLRVDREFWCDHPDLVQGVRSVVKQARAVLATSPDETDRAVLKEIDDAPRILRTAITEREEELCRRLRSLLHEVPTGTDVPDSPELREVLNSVEWYLTDVIREIHPECDYCFDGIEPRQLRKIGDNALEVRGMVWLLDDSCSLVPLHVRLQVAADEDRICWLECRVAKRPRAGSTDSVSKQLSSLYAQDEGAIDWAYEVGFGERQ
jgi:hypothetical protein